MTRSIRRDPISADVYVRGKAPLWSRSMKAIARGVTLPPPPPPPTKPARPVRHTAPRRSLVERRGSAPLSVARRADNATSTDVIRGEGAGSNASAAGGEVQPPGPDATVYGEVRLDPGVTIAVVDSDEIVRTFVRDQLQVLDPSVVAYERLEALSLNGPTVLVLGPSELREVAIKRIEPLLASRGDLGAVMLVSEASAEIMRAAFRVGMDDVVPLSADTDELLEAIVRAASRLSRPQEVVDGPVSPPSRDSLVPTGKVVTVFGTKGGTGKSVVATNMAISLTRQSLLPVVVVDANLQFGDVAIMLQLRPEHTISDVVSKHDLDSEALDNLLLHHKPSGLRVLAAPVDPISADQITRSDLIKILGLLRQRFAYIVVDTSPRIEESTLVALQAADYIVMLTTPDVMSFKNSRLALQTLQALNIPPEKLRLVVNHANTQLGLTRADAERAMGMRVDATLPSENTVAESVNRGTPVMVSAPSSKFGLAIDELARSLKGSPSRPRRDSPNPRTPSQVPSP